MNFSDFLSEALLTTSNFNPKIAIILFLLCSIGEIGFSLPYILETIWLLAGYHFGIGILSLPDLLLIWLVAQAGRQTGSAVLYYTGIIGLPPLTKFYKKYIEPKLPSRRLVPSGVARVTQRLANPSPFSIATGRLLGLRVPIAIAMSAKQKLSHLALGVLISSIIWDGIYIVVGRVVGATILPQSTTMLLYSLGGLTLLYLIILGLRYLWRFYPQNKSAH
jgi:membrane-associated protein